MRPGKTRGRAAVWTLALTLSGAHGASQTADFTSDFEGPAGLQGWRFSGEAGAGTLALGAGHRGQGARLEYRLACNSQADCAGIASASYTFSTPQGRGRNPVVSLWVRFTPEVEVFLATKDTGGHTLRFALPAATLEHPHAGDWHFVSVELKGKDRSVKGALSEIGIVAEGRGRSPLAGSVDFDDVRISEAPARFSLAATSAVEPAAPEAAELGPRLGVNIHLLADDRSLDAAHAAGFQFVRMDMLWANVERNGRYRFMAYDRLLRSLETRGMGVLWILDYGHPEHGGEAPRAAADIAAFARFAEEAAAHFKGRNVRYEVWNEPNTATFWKPGPNAAEYAALLRAVVPAMLHADPSAQIATGGLARIDAEYLERLVNSGLPAHLSAIGVHPYRKGAPETLAPQLAALRQWAGSALSQPLEIWDTEWGYSSSDSGKAEPSNGRKPAGRVRQAVLAARELLTVWTVGVPMAVWYDLRDDGPGASDPEHNYGLLDLEGNDKPAMQAVRKLMEAAAGRRFTGMIAEPPLGVHAIRLDGGTGTVFIVWTSAGRCTLSVDRIHFAGATGWNGAPVKTRQKPEGIQVEIDDLSGPVYLAWRPNGASAGEK